MQRLFLFLIILFFPVLAKSQEHTRLDSLHRQGVEQFTFLSDSLQIKQKLDSLKHLTASLDTLKLNQTLDSLQSLQLPVGEVHSKIDSIRSVLDVSAEANQEIRQLNQKLNQPLLDEQQKLQGKVDQAAKLDGVNQEALADLKEQTGIEVSTELPKVEGVSLESIEGTDLPVSNLPSVKLPQTALPEIEGLNQLKETVGKVGEVSEKIESYSEDVAKVAEGKLGEVENVDKLAEEQLMKQEEMELFGQGQGEAMQAAREFQQHGQEDFIKQKAAEEGTRVIIDHFAEHKDKLNAARARLNKYKGRYSEIKSLKELPKNPLKRNPLKGKPWQERFVVGNIWKFSKGNAFVMDVAPSVAYRIYDKLEVGAAYQWRLIVDKQAPLFLSAKDPLSGYNLFVDYKFGKGFFARGTFARLHTVPKNILPLAEEQAEKTWISSYEAGLGKSYTFYKNLKGYTLVQYSFSKGPFRPYESALQSKIGFYINGRHLLKPKRK